MQIVRFRCPECDQSLQIGADKAGRRVRCKRCLAHFLVPSPEEAAPTTNEVVTPTQPPRAKTRDDSHKAALPREKSRESDEVGSTIEGPHDEPRETRRGSRKKKRPSEAWRLPRLGLMMLLVGAAVTVLVEAANSFVSMVALRSPWTTLSYSGTVNFLTWARIGVSSAGVFTQLAGFGLCLFAPKESGAGPAAVTALCTTLLTGVLGNVLFWVQFRPDPAPPVGEMAGVNPEQVDRLVKAIKAGPEEYKKELIRFTQEEAAKRNERLETARRAGQEEFQKELQRLQQEQDAQMKRMLEDQKAQAQRMDEEMARLNKSEPLLRLWQILQTLLHGVYLISVPILLRTLARATNQKELEPGCDTLLKLGAGLFAVSLLTRFVGLLVFTRLANLMGLVLGGVVLLGLGWQVVYLMLLFQLWQAMSARR